jgi:hypothetical protein
MIRTLCSTVALLVMAAVPHLVQGAVVIDDDF